MVQGFIDKIGSNIDAYLGLSGKFTKEFAQRLLKDMFKDYISVDQALITNPYETSIGTNAISGYAFHITNREQVTMQADVTDYYIDTNRPVQDHIAWKPVEITLDTLQGEYLHNIADDVSHSPIYYQTMSVVHSFIPKMSDFELVRKAKQAVSRATGGTGVINTIANKLTSVTYGILVNAMQKLRWDLFSTFDDLYDEPEQKEPFEQQRIMFSYLEWCWSQGLPLQVTTSWRSYENMIITSLKPMRDNNADITNFTVTLKQVNKTATLVAKSDQKFERNAHQSSEKVSLGVQKGVVVDV